jgi:hypothetical protein
VLVAASSSSRLLDSHGWSITGRTWAAAAAKKTFIDNISDIMFGADNELTTLCK